jgi:hypothetical protein
MAGSTPVVHSLTRLSIYFPPVVAMPWTRYF